MTREVRGVKWVRVLAERPSCIPQGRPRGAKRDGVRYEEALTAQPSFAGTSHGVWLEFSDAAGHGFAQVDFLLTMGPMLVAFEAKLTWRTEAYVQLRKLYLPLLRELSGGPVGGVVVCQNLTQETPKHEVTSDVVEAFKRAVSGAIPTLHLPVLVKATPAKPAKSQMPAWWNKGQRGDKNRIILGV